MIVPADTGIVFDQARMTNRILDEILAIVIGLQKDLTVNKSRVRIGSNGSATDILNVAGKGCSAQEDFSVAKQTEIVRSIRCVMSSFIVKCQINLPIDDERRENKQMGRSTLLPRESASEICTELKVFWQLSRCH